MNILIINGSVRDSRATSRVMAWVEKVARTELGGAQISTIDLKELELPMFKEAMLPMMHKDRQPEGALKTWLEALEEADGYVFVTPEYNHGMPSGLKNAIDYIGYEIMKKPFAVVAHGAEGGARSAEQLKNVLNANIGAVPIGGSVNLVGMIGFADMISEDGDIKDESLQGKHDSLQNMLGRLKWFTKALKVAREVHNEQPVEA